MNYDEVEPLDRIRLLKIFIMPLTGVFAQILPMDHLRTINESIMNSHVLACGIHPKKSTTIIIILGILNTISTFVQFLTTKKSGAILYNIVYG